MNWLLHFAAGAVTSCPDGGDCSTGLPTPGATGAQLHSLLQIVFAIFGAIAILMFVIAGVNFVNAQGDPSKAARARSIVIYALVGVVVAVSANVMVAFVLGGF